MTDIVTRLTQYLQRVGASNAWSWVPGVRMHPDDIELLPKAEPKPIWAGGGMGGLSPLMGTPIFADDTVPRGGYEVATQEWIAAQARKRDQDRSYPTVDGVHNVGSQTAETTTIQTCPHCSHPTTEHRSDGCHHRTGKCDICSCQTDVATLTTKEGDQP